MDYENLDKFSRSNAQLRALVDLHTRAYQIRRTAILSAQINPEHKERVSEFINDIECFDGIYDAERDSYMAILESYMADGSITGNQFKMLRELLNKRVQLCMAISDYKNATGE